MPTIKKRFYKRKTSTTELNENQIIELMHGFSLAGKSSFQDTEEMKEAYFQHRQELLSRIGKGEDSFTSFQYGSRPFCYWQFENLPEERRIISYFKSDNSVNKEPMPIYESEFQFLKRNDLLIPYEEEKYNELQKTQRVTV